MDREINILTYLPQFLQEYKEIKAITDTENAELLNIYNALEVFKNGSFIDSCSEELLQRFEKAFNITPKLNSTLSVRRLILKAKYDNFVPYTMQKLIQLLSNLQGDTNIGIEQSGYTINITTRLNKVGQQETLAELLKNIIPCNLVVNSINNISVNSNSDYNYKSEFIVSNIQLVQSDTVLNADATAILYVPKGE